MKKFQLRVDSRNRICLTKVSKHLPLLFSAHEEDGKIILEPMIEIPAREAWIFRAENRKIFEEVKKGLSQKGTIKRGSFKKYLK